MTRFHATPPPLTSEALGVSDVPLLVGGVLDVGRHAAEVERVGHVEALAVALVDDGLRDAAVDAHREVLADEQELDRVKLAVIDRLVAEEARNTTRIELDVDE